jgi:hypothetical protein
MPFAREGAPGEAVEAERDAEEERRREEARAKAEAEAAAYEELKEENPEAYERHEPAEEEAAEGEAAEGSEESKE